MWPWCNLAASQKRPYCASVKSHSHVGLASRQWDTVDWACVLYDRRIHNDRANRSASSRQCACQLYSCRAGFFLGGGAKRHVTQVVQHPYSPDFGSLQLLVFPKAKIAVEMEEIFAYDCHTAHKLSQRLLTADWLVPLECDCSRMRSNVSSDWLPSYIKATRPVLEIFKMDRYFRDNPPMCVYCIITLILSFHT